MKDYKQTSTYRGRYQRSSYRRSYRRSSQKAHNRKKQSRERSYRSRSYRRDRNKRSYRSESSSSSSSSSCSRSSQSRQNSSMPIMTSGSTQRRRNAPHYHHRKGEIVGHKYRVSKVLGDGTFGRVLKAEYNHQYYAIKMIKPVEKYIKSAKMEKNIVKEINTKDVNHQFGIVKYVQSFYHRNHYCIVFQQLGTSLYQLVKKNDYRGFSKKLIRQFFYQILKSVNFLHKLGYTHTDLKPENILLQRDQFQQINPRLQNMYQKTTKSSKPYYKPLCANLRLIDFGSCTFHSQHHSSTINTRQYRSPQVLLQCCKWSQVSDIWSVGCIIVELFTGQLLFDTHKDKEHITMIQKNSGKLPGWMVRQAESQLAEMFGTDGYIRQSKIRKYLGQAQNVVYMKTVNQIFEDQPRLRDLLKNCLEIDPNHRISAQDALKHPYFTTK